jgi:hypothetical protein
VGASNGERGDRDSRPPPARKKPDLDGILRRDGDYVFLTDLDTAGFFMLEDTPGGAVPLASATKVTRTKFEFVFLDPEKRCEQLALDFVNDRCHRYADAIARLKKVIHRFHGRDFGDKRGKTGARVFGDRTVKGVAPRTDGTRPD